ncbi:protein tyrosine phosphatase family protein [Novosphingobium sp. 9U]|uniref:protein tyrosine phosphatase family protein n=1 Tax=Novosphingobium sp. 9U TaxID=2653158 RepID=UPI00135ACDD5|nr:protein tyrosine phosphatase family protein [Novosphingobium sp. 9U]
MANDPEEIACWQRIGPHLTTSGRLSQADLERLAHLQVTRVINLALADSPGILADEDEQLAALDIGYTHIPVPFDAPTDEHFATFCQAMAEAQGQTVHVHCVMNWRVAAFLYRWHRETQGMAEADARALMERQWSPQTSENRDAPGWARFIEGRAD